MTTSKSPGTPLCLTAFPFPLTEAESELFDGSKLTDELSLTYTPFSEALAATYRAMKGIYL